LLVPALVVLIVDGGRGASYVAAAVFAVGALTDGVDGYLARRYDSVTRTGQWLDPLADKLLVSAPVITLTALDRFPLWAAVIIVVRELGVVGIRVYAGLRGHAMPATPMAKLKTVFQILAIILYLLPLGTWADGLRLGVLVVAVILTVVTGGLYALDAVRIERSRDPRQ
jgi:CDP-diacylglycerol---glycerol-3-phosphate 3-phosphatidyltransferase